MQIPTKESVGSFLTLEDCLAEVVKADMLESYICDGCSLRASLTRIRRKLDKYTRESESPIKAKLEKASVDRMKKFEKLCELEHSIESFLFHSGPFPSIPEQFRERRESTSAVKETFFYKVFGEYVSGYGV